MPQSLYRSFRETPNAGEPVPMPFEALRKRGVIMRKGQVTVIGGPPGGGKSALTLNYLIGPGVKRETTVLYLSPDSDIMTLGPRMLASMTGHYVRDVFESFDNKDEKYYKYLELAKSLNHIQWCFQPAPTFQDISDELTAYEAVHGHFPDIVILDNIRDVEPDNGAEDWQGYSRVVDVFQVLARKINAAVILLHHLKGEYSNGDKEPQSNALMGNVDKNARLSLLLWQPSPDVLGVYIGKNSNGPRKETVELSWNMATQAIR